MYVQLKKFYMPDSPGQAGSGSGTSSIVGNAVGSSAIGGGIGLLSTTLGILGQRAANKASMKYQDEWAWRQRQWALEDRDYNNWYNSPAEQRKRMIEGGMNPALMYGAGGSAGVSQPVRSTQSPSFTPAPLDYSGYGRVASNTLDQYYNIKMKEATLQQMNIQNELLESNISKNTAITQLTWNKAALTDSENQKVSMWLDDARKYALDAYQGAMPESLGSYYLDQMFQQNRNAGMNWQFKMDENQRRAILAAGDADVLAERIGLIAAQTATTKAQADLIRANISLAIKSGLLKDIDINGAKLLNTGSNVGNTFINLLRVIIGKR